MSLIPRNSLFDLDTFLGGNWSPFEGANKLGTFSARVDVKENKDSYEFSGRTLDIDILMYGNTVGEVDGVTLPREEILENAFVLQPLAELAPDLIHPQQQQTISTLWKNYDKQRQRLWRVAFDWHPSIVD